MLAGFDAVEGEPCLQLAASYTSGMAWQIGVGMGLVALCDEGITDR